MLFRLLSFLNVLFFLFLIPVNREPPEPPATEWCHQIASNNSSSSPVVTTSTEDLNFTFSFQSRIVVSHPSSLLFLLRNQSDDTKNQQRRAEPFCSLLDQELGLIWPSRMMEQSALTAVTLQNSTSLCRDTGTTSNEEDSISLPIFSFHIFHCICL